MACIIATNGARPEHLSPLPARRARTAHIDFVLTRIAELQPDVVQYLQNRLAGFGSFIDGIGAEGGFVLHAEENPAKGYIALKAVPNNNVEDMRYTIAHELAHAYHRIRAADMDAAQGTKTEFTQRQLEEAADKIVADDWGLPVPLRDMKAYDLVDALNVIQAENAKKKTEQGD